MSAIAAEPALGYLPRLLREWSGEPDRRHRLVTGSLLFIDLSGFTKMTERLATLGRRGAEEVAEIISETFALMLAGGYRGGGSLLKFGGDALLLLFEGEGHERAAAWGAWEAHTTLREHGRFDTPAGRIRLGMTGAISSGPIHLFLVGEGQRELLVAGPAVSVLMDLERRAPAGATLVSPATVAALPDSTVTATPEGRFRLTRQPPLGRRQDIEAPPPRGPVTELLPRAVRHRLGEGEARLEHRHVAVGFVGIGGLDSLIASDPDAAAAALAEIVTAADRAACAHGAWLLASDVAADGAKLIITAGAPVATGHDEAALLLSLSDLVRVDVPLSVRLGANHGTVFFGDIGPTYRRTLTVMGDTVNTAARLMGVAQPGSVLAAESMLRSRSVSFTHGPSRELNLRGRKAALAAVEVTGPATAPSHVDGGRLVGRDEELSRLAELHKAAMAGTGAVVEVTGPPGSGRSMVVGEFLRRSTRVEARVEASLHEGSIPFHVARQLFSQITAIDPDSRDAAERLVTWGRRHAPDRMSDLVFAARALGIRGMDESAMPPIDPRYVPAITGATLSALLAGGLPTGSVVAVDDAHLGDAASTDLLVRLGAMAGAAGWLICVTVPDHTQIDWGDTQVTGVDLELLDDSTVRAIALSLTEDDPLSSHELAEVVARAGGSPLALGEILAARRNGFDVSAIPTAVEGLAAMRIDRLEPDRRRQLEMASVLGVAFSSDRYAQVTGLDPDELTGWGDDLLVRGETGIRFSSPVIRDVIYDRLPFAHRTAIHARVAETLGGTSASDELAFHLFRAERWAEARKAAIVAAEDAESKSAHIEAIRWYEQALEATRHAPIDEEAETELWERLGELRERAGEFSTADAAFRRAGLLATDPSRRARALLGRARMLERLGSYQAALGALTRAKRLAPESADVVVAAIARYGGIRFNQGRHREALRLAEQAAAAATGDDTRASKAFALMIFDMARSALGEAVDGAASRQALQTFQELGDLDRQARVTNNLGLFAFYAGNWDEAGRLYDESRRVFSRIGDEVNASYGAANLAEIWAFQGRFEEAEALFREVRRVWRAADDKYGAAYIEGHLGLIAAHQGRTEEAIRRLEASLEQFRSIGARAEVSATAVHLLEALLLAGDAAAARGVVDRFHLEQDGSPRTRRLLATLRSQQGSRAPGQGGNMDRLLAADLEAVRQGSAALDELRLLELACRLGSPMDDPGRRRELAGRLGTVASPVYPVS